VSGTRIDISIITPVRNNVKRIGQCLHNVLEQHYPRCEHIVVDAASTDGTLEALRRFAAQYPHVRFISEPDKGQAEAMNKGIRLARGRFVGILNADDYYEPGALARAAALLAPLPEPAFVVGNCNVWRSETELQMVNKPRKLALEELLLGFDINPFPVNPAAYFYSRSLHDQIGFYDEGHEFAMDVEWLFRAAGHCKLSYYDEDWGNFRLYEDTKTFREMAGGRTIPRNAALAEAYIRQLPWRRRLKIRTAKAAVLSRNRGRYYWGRLKHYGGHPRGVPGLIKRKLKMGSHLSIQQGKKNVEC